MPITFLYYIAIVVLTVLLIINVVVPLFIPRYKLFWLFRKDKYSEAVNCYNEAQKTKEAQTIVENAHEKNDSDRMLH